jgi:hypothetical protein
MEAFVFKRRKILEYKETTAALLQDFQATIVLDASQL